MKVLYLKFFGLAAVLGLASVSFGQTLTLVNAAGDNNGASVNIVGEGGVYDSPYQMSLNSSATTVAMFCDDAADTVYDGEIWNVTSVTLATITAASAPIAPPPPQYVSDSSAQIYGNPLDPNTTTAELTQAEKYIAAVDLAVEINSLPEEGSTDAERGDLSLALWDVMDPLGMNTSLTANANTYLQSAIKVAQGDEGVSGEGTTITEIGGYSATIYTSNPRSGAAVVHCPSGDTCNAPQEFIQLSAVPEPSSMAALGFDFVGAGLVGLYFLRRKSSARS